MNLCRFFFRRRLAPSALAFLLSLASAHAEEAADVSSNAGGAAATTLDPVTVTGLRAEPYAAADATTGTKTDTPLIETPQSISVITAEQIRDQGAQTVQDALRYTAGVYADAYGTDSRGDYSLIRGTDYLSYLDGTRQLAPDFIYVRPDPYQLERIDVLKGPASVLYGQSTAGGIVNLVSKQPLAEVQGELAAQYGTYDRRQLQADFTGPIDAEKKWLYRVVAVGRYSNTQVDTVDNDRALLIPSISWRPSADTRLTVRGTWQYDSNGSTSTFPPQSGTLLPNPNGRIPTSRFTSEPGFDRFDTAQYGLAYEFEQKFEDRFALRQNFRYTRARIDYQSLYPDSFSNPDDPFIDADDRVLNRFFYVNNLRSRTFTVDNQAQANFSTGPFQHQMLFGIDYARLSETGVTAGGFATPIDIYAPVYGTFTPPTSFNQKPKLTQDQIGFYGQDQIKFGGGWVALGSLRHDRATNDSDALGEIPASTQTDSATTFRIGALYRSANGLAPYASYSQSFNPVLGLNGDGSKFKPLRGQQIETGLKWQPVGMQSFVTAAVFEIREKNRLTTGADPSVQVQLGEGRSRGFEVEGTASLIDRLDLIGSYTYTQVVVSKSGVPEEEGRRIASIPRQQASVWAHYRLPLFDPGSGLGSIDAGAGVRYVGDSYDGVDVLRTPSVTLVDALLGYDRGSWRFAVNASNLLDKTYETTCLARGDCFIGARRTVVGTVSWRY